MYASKHSVDGESVFLSLQLYFHRVFFSDIHQREGPSLFNFFLKIIFFSYNILRKSFTLQALFSSHLISHKEQQQFALISCLAMYFSEKKSLHLNRALLLPWLLFYGAGIVCCLTLHLYFTRWRDLILFLIFVVLARPLKANLSLSRVAVVSATWFLDWTTFLRTCLLLFSALQDLLLLTCVITLRSLSQGATWFLDWTTFYYYFKPYKICSS